MSIPIEHSARLLIERVFDILWHNEVIKEDITEIHLKDYLLRDIIIQLELIIKDAQVH